MSKNQGSLETDMSPTDMLAGLGSANRNLLATSLALFDDSQLQRRLLRVGEQAGENLTRWSEKLQAAYRGDLFALPSPEMQEVQKEARELGERQVYWRDSAHSDDMLRLLLWARLRDALGLPPRMTTTWRGCGYLADDMAAKLIHVLDPPGMVKSSKRWLHKQGWLKKGQQATNLTDIVLPVLDELLERMLEDEQEPPDRDERRQLLAQAISSLGDEENRHLLVETRANQTNDEAMIKALLISVPLVGFGVGVSTAGFSAYILAAQASAFIPWVSGPGLVSFVSVMSNPVTILGIAGGGAWWLAHSAREKVNVAISARVIAMLTLNGLHSGRSGLEGMLRSFALAPYMPKKDGLPKSLLEAHRTEWEGLAPLAAIPNIKPPEAVLHSMASRLDPDVSKPDLEPTDDSTTGTERDNLAAMATLTVGDMLYSIAAVEPTVLAAADFSRVADIDAGLSFAQLAEQILGGDQAAALGSLSQLKGYVAEQAVASELASAGHTISFPEAANQPGWDLLIDGQPFQVKFHATLDGLRQHFDHHDYPVIANTELIDSLPGEWADKVFFVEGLSNELVDHVTRESLAAGADILDPAVIPAAGAISAARGLLAYRRGQLTGKQALEQVMLDGMVRIGLAGSGGIIGAGVGVMLFGPAGAWVLGAGAPVFSQMLTPRITRLLRDKVKGDAHRQWEDGAHDRLDALQHQILIALRHKREQLDTKLGKCPDTEPGHYLRWRLEDDHRYTLECQQRLMLLEKRSRPQPEQRLADTLRVMAVSGVHPAIYQPELLAASEHLKHRPGLTDLLDHQLIAETTRQVRGTAEQWWQDATSRRNSSNGNDEGSR